MNFIHNELLERLEAKDISREEMRAYIEDLKTLYEKYFGTLSTKMEILAFVGYENPEDVNLVKSKGFHFLAKVTEPLSYFYIFGAKSFDEDGWEQWSVESKFACDHKHTQHDLHKPMNAINWFYFNHVNNLVDSSMESVSLAGENFNLEAPESLVGLMAMDASHELLLRHLELENITPTSAMGVKEYNDIVDFYNV